MVYLPREANKVTDFLAGVASAYCRDNKHSLPPGQRHDVTDQYLSQVLACALLYGFDVTVPATSLVRPVIGPYHMHALLGPFTAPSAWSDDPVQCPHP